MSSDLKREVLSDGCIEISAGGCSFRYSRPRQAALKVTITGHDRGQFGTSTLDEIAVAIARDGKIELFVDAREAVGAAVSVSDEWTRFFYTNRGGFSRVHVLVGSKVVYLTIAIAQHLSRTGDLIQIYSDPAIFENRLRAH